MNLRMRALKVPAFRRGWAWYRSRHMEARYEGWSAKYRREAEYRGIKYDPVRITRDVRNRLQGRNVKTRRMGDIHTAIMTMTRNWGIGMVQELREFGEVSLFDNEAQGFSESDPQIDSMVPELNRRLYDFLLHKHAERPIDWIFLPCSGKLVLKDTLRRIREGMGVPIVNQWLDCKQSFEGGMGPNGQDLGMRDIAPEFDLVWTSSRSVCEWYMVLGALPVFLPEGFSPQLTPRIQCPKKHDIGFLGMCYGLRPDLIQALRKAGLKVAARGYGWHGPDERPIPLSEMGQFIAECRVNLGIGGVGYSMKLTTLKGRDFEVPGAGGAYLTAFNPDLAEFFRIGQEILCYHSVAEMVELAHRLVRNEALRVELADRAYERSIREHRWMHRFRTILEILGILDPDQSMQEA